MHEPVDRRSLLSGGLNYMRYSVSDTAEYGDYVSARVCRRNRLNTDEASISRHSERQILPVSGLPKTNRVALSSIACGKRIRAT